MQESPRERSFVGGGSRQRVRVRQDDGSASKMIHALDALGSRLGFRPRRENEKQHNECDQCQNSPVQFIHSLFRLLDTESASFV